MTSSTTDALTVGTTHTVFVAAPPKVVYNLLADPARWPYIFSPIVHVERLAGGASDERLRLWAVANGAVRSWISRRTLDPNSLRIRFRQETPSAPVAMICGEWVLVPLPDNATSVVLLHEFRAVNDSPAATMLIKQAVDRNSTAQLAELKHIAEQAEQLPMLVHSFAESVIVKSPAGPVYDFLHRAQDWPRRLPHVARLTLDEVVPNVQTIEMDAASQDGSMQTTRSIRVCFPYHSIVYKQTLPPEFMAAHLGAWHLYPTAEGVRVSSNHTVLVSAEKVRAALGPGATAERVRGLVRQLLGSDSLSTLMHAKSAAEGLVDLRELSVPLAPHAI